jgi:hypothetical protein
MPRMAAAQGKERPMAQKASAAQQIAGLGAPRVNLRLTRGAGTAPQNPCLARGLGTPSDEFSPRSKVPAPRVRLHLARGHPRPAALYLLHDRDIKHSDTSRAPGSKADPRHTDPLTLPGNHILMLFDQPALCSHPRCYAGRPVSFRRTMPPIPILRVPVLLSAGHREIDLNASTS